MDTQRVAGRALLAGGPRSARVGWMRLGGYRSLLSTRPDFNVNAGNYGAVFIWRIDTWRSSQRSTRKG